MKKLLLIFAFLIALGNITFAQKSKKGASEVAPPAPVEKAFNTKYKLAKNPFWTEEDENFRVDFKYNDVKSAACYSADGKMLYTEKELSKAQHNKTALKYILENYAGYKVLNMRKRDTYDKKTTYIAMLRKTKELLEVEFDKKGGFIRDTDKTPVTASKKKNKKEEDEETSDEEEKPAKKDTKAKKSKSNDEDGDDEEEAKPAPKPEKAKPAPAPKKTDDDEEEAKPAPKPEKVKAAPKKTNDDDEDDEEEAKPAPKKEKEKAKPAPKKEKKKTDDDEDEDE